MERKVGVEIQIRDGSAKLLAAARHRTQSLEAARALFISNEKMSMYLKELQRRKKHSSEISSKYNILFRFLSLPVLFVCLHTVIL